MEELLLAALETLPNFVVVDADGHIVYLNEGYASLLGTTSSVAIGQMVTDVIPGTRLHIVLKTGKAEMGSVMTLYDHVTMKDIMFVCNRIPIRKNGQIVGAVAATTINDILDVTRLHQELEKVKKERSRYKAELTALKNSINPLDQVVGVSASIEEIKRTITDYAASNLTVLITGETGVGKEVCSRAVHHLSGRPLDKYVKLNCAAIPESLLESELFGYVEGAFTGASKGGKIGKFEQANGGTLLLDEISEMSLDLQAKLLRVLQEKEVERIGSTKPLKLNTRIICSTNQNLEQLVQKGQFREDLYYRINVLELAIPPLRTRPDDILPLCQAFIDKVNQENGYAITGVSEEVLQLFRKYRWPGNVRELEHVIERAAVQCKSGLITAEYVDFLAKRFGSSTEALSHSDRPLPLRDRTQQAERESILLALKQAGGNKTKAAQLLGIDRSRLYHKIRKYNLL